MTDCKPISTPLEAKTKVSLIDMFSILKNTGKEERYTIGVFVLRDPLVVS
jgi:hypothetical protein